MTNLMMEREEYIRKVNTQALIEGARLVDPNYKTPMQVIGTMAWHAAKAHPYIAAGVALVAAVGYVCTQLDDKD